MTDRQAVALASRDLTYHSYLRLRDLLSLQRPFSDDPGELHFIVAHQSMELMFKLMLAELRNLVALFDADKWCATLPCAQRLNHQAQLALEHMRSLRDLPVTSFHGFRGLLGTASGAQSTQFREIEVLSGLRDPGYLAVQRRLAGGRLPDEMVRALQERDLATAHQAAARRLGVTDWARLYREEGCSSPCYLVSECLLDYDDLFLAWRNEHLALVERMLGSRVRGTAGTDPLSFLERTRRYRFFPYLWEMRSDLAADAGGRLVD
ncbi:tryptophan 2,3-dioxygenase family protein [Nonomuraea sediminis]|uniref:tryptophan 2,3-dioxygenase family protein n=1 Tax=Nonomuraea sediminis TaxID=2835864 RepID=UPI001BDD689E|nr:tryptophan 2,3-dioxygenase family protein [Nonomuraea sediminis]